MESNYPEYLKDYSSLFDFFEKELQGVKNNKEKGDKFAKFAQKTIKHTKIGPTFPEPTINPKASHDDGVDLYCESKDGSEYLYIQCKYRIADKMGLNGILSEFEKFDIKNVDGIVTSSISNNQLKVTQGTLNLGLEKTYRFAIVAMNRLDTILKNYCQAKYSTLNFYQKLIDEGRLEIIDGAKILKIYQDLYKTTYIVPPTIEVEFDSNIIVNDNVYIGILV